jgi:hypothetical protein
MAARGKAAPAWVSAPRPVLRGRSLAVADLVSSDVRAADASFSLRLQIVAAMIAVCPAGPPILAAGPRQPDVDALLQHLDDLYWITYSGQWLQNPGDQSGIVAPAMTYTFNDAVSLLGTRCSAANTEPRRCPGCCSCVGTFDNGLQEGCP